MYTLSTHLYDIIYASVDPAPMVEQVLTLISRRKRSPGTALLDVACGTGNLISLLRRHYSVEGLDLDPYMLDIARRKEPDITFHQADMVTFDLGRRFDVITCLGSAIAAVKTLPRLRQTLQSMSHHLHPGGVVIIEPWLIPEVYKEGNLHALLVDRPDLKIARMNISKLEGRVSVLDLHYLVATPEGVQYFTERLDLGLFSHDDYVRAFSEAGLEMEHDAPEGSNGRGLYSGVFQPSKPQADV
ncbi:MAG: class I SAM-dependent methyltransferase [Chloroflexia bacterium]